MVAIVTNGPNFSPAKSFLDGYLANVNGRHGQHDLHLRKRAESFLRVAAFSPDLMSAPDRMGVAYNSGSVQNLLREAQYARALCYVRGTPFLLEDEVTLPSENMFDGIAALIKDGGVDVRFVPPEHRGRISLKPIAAEMSAPARVFEAMYLTESLVNRGVDIEELIPSLVEAFKFTRESIPLEKTLKRDVARVLDDHVSRGGGTKGLDRFIVEGLVTPDDDIKYITLAMIKQCSRQESPLQFENLIPGIDEALLDDRVDVDQKLALLTLAWEHFTKHGEAYKLSESIAEILPSNEYDDAMKLRCIQISDQILREDMNNPVKEALIKCLDHDIPYIQEESAYTLKGVYGLDTNHLNDSTKTKIKEILGLD